MRHLTAIDGLRAIAVLAVVAYHAGLPVPAGFIGVDVFFVISGYLITRLLHEEVQRSGRIDIAEFYARRARRILPALAALVALTLIAAALILPPAEQQRAMQSGVAAFAFASNVFFQLAPAGYFDPTSDQQPLLHLWSLGVEEQFYLAWPLILILARRKPAVALVAVVVVSMFIAETVSPKSAFYLAPARAWELAAGGLVALRPMRLPKGSGWGALALVLVACFIPLPHFPGVGAVPAVVGSTVLIAAIQNGERNRLLESKLMVAIGLMSYSLYLWHWPLLVLGKRLELPVPLLVGLSFLFAAGSYRYIETPWRRQGTLQARWVVVAGVVLMAVGGVAAAGRSYQLNGRIDPPSIYAIGCDDWFHSAAVKPCVFGPADATHTAVIMGDSVGLQWLPAWQEVFAGWRVVVLTKSSCPMVDAPFFYARLGREYTECTTWRNNALVQVTALHPDVLVLGSTSNYGFSEGQWIAGTSRILGMVPTARRIVLMRPTPLLQTNPSHDPANEVLVLRALRSATAGYENVRLVDMNDQVCPNGICRVSVGDCTVFRDDTHITSTFARSLAPMVAERGGFQKPRPKACSW